MSFRVGPHGRVVLVALGCTSVVAQAVLHPRAPFRLLCPYDLEALAADVIDEAHRTHPFGTSDGLAR